MAERQRVQRHTIEKMIRELVLIDKPTEPNERQVASLVRSEPNNPYCLAALVYFALKRKRLNHVEGYYSTLKQYYPEHEATVWATEYTKRMVPLIEEELTRRHKMKPRDERSRSRFFYSGRGRTLATLVKEK